METADTHAPKTCPCCGQTVDVEPDVVRPTDVINAVEAVTGTARERIFAATRQRESVEARKLISYVLAGYGYTHEMIARVVMLDRTTVSTHIRHVQDAVEVYPHEQARLMAVYAQLTQ